MNTVPEPPPDPSIDTGSAPSKSPDSGRLMLLFATAYPLVVGTVLWALGHFGLLGLQHNESSYAVLFVGASLVLIGGAHFWLQSILKGRGEARPWQLPTVLSTAMSAAIGVELAAVFLGVDTVLPLPLVCVGLCLLGAAGFALLKGRFRFAGTLTAVIVVALLLAGRSWWVFEQDQEQEQVQKREELMQEVSDVPHEIAVLSSSEWEPSDIVTSPVSHRVYITYEPTASSPELDGLSLTLRTEPMEAFEETGSAPLYEPCESESGHDGCEEHGDVVVADTSEGSSNTLTARTELTEGVAAYLISTTQDSEGDPDTETPDIDMEELGEVAENIRPTEAGEVEEIVSAIVD